MADTSSSAATSGSMFSRPGSYTLYSIMSQLRALPYPTQDCTGQTIIVTGANVGLGLEAARHFVRLGATRVILAVRNVEKGEKAKANIDASMSCAKDVVQVWQVDLGSFESVKQFCRRADAELDRLDALVENAGVVVTKYEEAEGYEQTITVNVISTFLMAVMMLPVLRRSAIKHNIVPKLVIVSSDAHFQAVFKEQTCDPIFDEFKGEKNMRDRYSLSKLLEVLIVRELAAHMSASDKPFVVLNALNPGLCATELFREVPGFSLMGFFISLALMLVGRSAEEGSRSLIASATCGEEAHGKYFSHCVVREESPFVTSEQGHKVGKKVYQELMEILEGIEPGVTKNI